MVSLAVARLSIANSIREPMTWLVIAIGVVLVGLSYLFGMFSFEDSSRMRLLITAGVATSMLCGMFIGVVGVGQSVHDELTTRTAVTLFAKPIARHSFLIGKIIGALSIVALVSGVIIVAHLAIMALAQHSGFDHGHHHHGHHDPSQVGFVPWGRTLAAHALAFASTSILVCIAAVLALRLPLALTTMATLAVFIVANLLAALGVGTSVLLPGLHIFHVDDSLHFYDVSITTPYFLLCLLHAVLYGGACVIIGSAMLRNQDIP
ncbi:MAG: hypothetical protein EA401_12685 [Planctomycetota bacterium]|nr:MAG: hypothetical protein EA401_12685 [Planctomycetota bacterium]